MIEENDALEHGFCPSSQFLLGEVSRTGGSGHLYRRDERTAMKTFLQALFSGALLLAALFGCSHGGRTAGASFAEGGAEASVRVFVTNRNFMDATIWAITTGSRQKLGVVSGKGEEVFTIPWAFPTDLWLEIDMLAGDRCATESIPVDPGDDLEVVIDVDMNGSPLCRRRVEAP
jgi:hypothetical protein